MDQPARPRRRTAVAAAGLLGIAGTVVLVTSGSPPGGVLRALVALGVAGAVLRAQRSGARVAGWSALMVGAVALAAAAPIAADHLAGGAVVRGVAALLAALAALVLVVVGTGTLWRATRRWWRLLALPVAFVLLQLVMVPVAMAVLPTNRVHADLGADTPADHGLQYEDVALRTPDGVDLAAWWIPGRRAAAVVLLHGAGSTRTSTLDHAEALAGLGYGVLMVDARGHGASGGTAMDLGWDGVSDVLTAVDWLAGQRDPVRIGVVGLSMGGEEALTAAANDPRIRAVVAEGVGVRVAADAPPEGWLPDAVNRLITATTDLLTSADPPRPLREVLADLRAWDTPTLLIAGSGEGDQAEWLAGAAGGGSVQIWDVPDAGHTAALDEHRDEWLSRVGDVLAVGLPPL